jgi:hypothetical protein
LKQIAVLPTFVLLAIPSEVNAQQLPDRSGEPVASTPPSIDVSLYVAAGQQR